MNSFMRMSLCAFSGAVALAAVAGANPITVTINNSYGNGNGGEFLLTPNDFPLAPLNIDGGPAFESFCVEKNENISFGGTYYAVIATGASHGGVSGGDPDALDGSTAYLYSAFIKGALPGYVYNVGDGGIARAASADALQDVIWVLEGEQAPTWTLGDNSLRDQFYNLGLAHAADSINDVRILQLYGDEAHTQFAQDQLVRLPGIPEPTTLLLVLAGAGLLRRR